MPRVKGLGLEWFRVRLSVKTLRHSVVKHEMQSASSNTYDVGKPAVELNPLGLGVTYIHMRKRNLYI